MRVRWFILPFAIVWARSEWRELGVALRSTIVVLTCFGLAACGRQSSEPTEGLPLATHFTAQGPESDPDVALSLELARAAYLTIHSSEFERNLAALGKTHPAIFARSNEPDVPLERVAELMKDRRSRFWPVKITIVGGNDPHDPAYYEASTGLPTHLGGEAVIFLGRRHLERYRSRDVVERSCAINTMAHEMAHTVSLTPVLFTRAFGDTVREQVRIEGRKSHSPVASYLVGAVAQCTWLQGQGRIAPWAISECVEVFGVRSFNSLRCNRFGPGTPVQLGAFLPPAAEPL